MRETGMKYERCCVGAGWGEDLGRGSWLDVMERVEYDSHRSVGGSEGGYLGYWGSGIYVPGNASALGVTAF